jgi:hypothetical protein
VLWGLDDDFVSPAAAHHAKNGSKLVILMVFFDSQCREAIRDDTYLPGSIRVSTRANRMDLPRSQVLVAGAKWTRCARFFTRVSSPRTVRQLLVRTELSQGREDDPIGGCVIETKM